MATTTTKKAISLPPVYALRTSLMLVSTGHVDEAVKVLKATSTDQVRRWARTAQKLSEKACFFCGSKRTKKQNGSTKSWDGYYLCDCMTEEVPGVHVLGFPAWTQRTNEAPASDLKKLIKQLEGGKLDEDALAYSNSCSDCTKRFNITFGQVAHAVKKHSLKTYRFARRCKTCRSKVRQPPTKAARPTRKKATLAVVTGVAA